MTDAELETAMDALSQIETFGVKQWGAEAAEYSCILIVYNIDTGIFDYKFDDRSAKFYGDFSSDPAHYLNESEAILETVLNSYGWNLLQ